MSAPEFIEAKPGTFIEVPEEETFVEYEFDDTPIRKHFREAWEKIEPRKDLSFSEAFAAGWQQSVWGLGKREKLPEIFLPEEPYMGDRLAAQVGTLAGDFPFMVAGAALGAASGGGVFSAATAFGGAFALPAGIRRVLMETYEKGKIKSFERFWQVLSAATIDEFKAWTVGATTGAAGKIAGVSPILPNTARFAAEVSTMATMGAAMEGRVVEPEEILDTAIIIGGLHGARITSGKLREVYARTGKRPYELIEDTKIDPTIKEDLNSINHDVPRALKVEPKAAEKPAEIEPAKPEIPKPEKVEPVAEQVTEAMVEVTEAKRPPPPVEAPVEKSEAYEHVRSRISIGEKPPKKPLTWNRVYTLWLNKRHPLKVVTRAMLKAIRENKDPEATLKITDDAYRLAMLKPGVSERATEVIDYAMIDYNTLQPVSKALRSVVEPLGERLEELDVYAVSKRVVELHNRGVTETGEFKVRTGVDDAYAREVVREYENTVVEKLGLTFEQLRVEMREYNRGLLRYLRDSGIVGQEKFELLEAAGENFLPFHRVMEEPTRKAGRGKGLQPRDPILRIFGSDKPIIDPIETTLKNTYVIMNLAENNRIGRALIKLAERTPEGERWASREQPKARKIVVSEAEKNRLLKKFLVDREKLTDEESGIIREFLEEEIGIFRADALRPRAGQIAVYRNGKREVWNVDDEVAEAFQGSSAGELDALINFFGAPARTLRAGAILTPEFMARNPIRDQFMAFLNSDSGYRFAESWFRGIYHIAKKDEIYHQAMRSGGPMAEIVALDRQYNQVGVRDIMRSNFQRNARNTLRNPIEGARILSTLSEMGTRVGAFERAMKGKEPTPENLLEAGMVMREISVDFGRMGVLGEKVNRVIPFFNVTLQGMDKMRRMFRDHPVAYSAKILTTITLPSIALYLHNRTIEGWDEIAQWRKDLGWLIPVDADSLGSFPDVMKVHVGDKAWFMVPKPFEPGIAFGSGAERLVAMILKDDPHAFDDFADAMWRAGTPSMVPQAIVPIFETWGNRSFFFDRPIIPKRRENALPQYQYQPYTTELTKAIGKLMAELPIVGDTKAASPVVIDNFIYAYTGGLGTHIKNLADAALRKAGILPDPIRPMDTLADLPFFKAFFARHPSFSAEPIQDFFEGYADQKMILNTIDVLRRDGEYGEWMKLQKAYAGRTINLDSIYETITGLASTGRKLHNNPDPRLTPEERSQIYDQIMNAMIWTAKSGNEILDRMEKRQ